MKNLSTILYIEDNPENRLLVRRLLESTGYQVIEADSAQKVLDNLEYYQPDLILMDLNMPSIDGYTLTSRLRSIPKYKNTPIIAISANVIKGAREKAIQAGCDDYIEKPINIDNFIDQINHFFQHTGR